MVSMFALTMREMGLGKVEIIIITLVCIIFPTLFFLSSKNLDSKGVFQWMMEKPDDWIGKK
tara:strand:- start:397 stop:579 length:183 start_codon:yes stop_codon:yes gene_type:complete